MPREIHLTEPISVPEVREFLIDRAKEAREKKEEISYMQGIALEHSMITSRISGKDAKEIVEFLVENYRISNMGSISIANTMPDTIDELRQVLDPESKKMETETLDEILEKLNSYNRLESKTQINYYEDDFLEEFDDKEKELPDEIPEDLLN